MQCNTTHGNASTAAGLICTQDETKKGGMDMRCQNDYNNEDRKEEMELPIFDLTTISNAIDNFASRNKLGEGGFGSVYKTIADLGIPYFAY
uniref:Uncharacterized protein n=1 Tax=Quercus lobata TaxID=97700 RepID=A0A7N2L356_QUELO